MNQEYWEQFAVQRTCDSITGIPASAYLKTVQQKNSKASSKI